MQKWYRTEGSNAPSRTVLSATCFTTVSRWCVQDWGRGRGVQEVGGGKRCVGGGGREEVCRRWGEGSGPSRRRIMREKELERPGEELGI